MTDPSRRTLELLSLLQDGRTWRAAELTERLGASPRTLRRDIERLREIGYPVLSARGPDGGYRLVAGRAVPPLPLTDDEAVAAVAGLRFAALARVDGATGAADGVLRKLRQALPPRLRSRIEAVSASTEAVSRTAAALDLHTVQVLGSAAHEHRHVRFGYTSRDGRPSERRVEPYRLILLDRHWYLLGWDRDRRDWRTFRVDRIEEVHSPGTTFTPREPPEDPAAFPSTRGGEAAGVVRFAAPLGVVAERLVAETGVLEEIDAGNCRYVTAADSWEWLAMALASVGVPYRIEGPPELIAQSRLLARRIADAAGG
ncbi:helix-turn-helix transcriptional regulator [Actinomadura fibrosa]|uniref:Helix-turn-helix transcriptional regulator n=1 Tax=Actinomadura fibrosa TaxID=111802 RepID=A0ABW2XU03_9ACTN|nr:YafY family protein [Actinomadura fibrosa]